MKRVLCLIVMLSICLLALCSCGGTSQKSDNSANSSIPSSGSSATSKGAASSKGNVDLKQVNPGEEMTYADGDGEFTLVIDGLNNDEKGTRYAIDRGDLSSQEKYVVLLLTIDNISMESEYTDNEFSLSNYMSVYDEDGFKLDARGSGSAYGTYKWMRNDVELAPGEKGRFAQVYPVPASTNAVTVKLGDYSCVVSLS